MFRQKGKNLLSKRQILKMMGLVLYSSSVAPRPAFSQAFSGTYQAAISQLESDLAIVFSPAQGIQPTPGFIDQFLSVELSARVTFFEQIEIATPAELARELVPDASEINLVIPDEVSLIVADPMEVEPVKINRDLPPIEGETRIELLLNIFVDTIDWRFAYDGLRWLATEDEVFSNIVQDMGNSLGIRDMPGLIENVIRLVGYVTSTDTIARLGEQLGMASSELRQRLYKALGLRLIPYAGWAFTGACLAACIYAYRQRIAAVILP